MEWDITANEQHSSYLCSFATQFAEMTSGNLHDTTPGAGILDEARRCHLAIHLYSGGYQIAIFDPSEGEFLWIHNQRCEVIHPAPFQDVTEQLLKLTWIRSVFRTITVSFDTPEFTLAPTGMIQPGKEGELLSIHSGDQDNTIQSVNLAESAITIVYRVPAEVLSLTRVIQGARLYPSSSLFLRYVMGHHDRQVNDLHVLIEPGYLILSAMLKGSHHMTNHFEVHTEEDVLYFISHAAIRLGVDLEFARLNLYGDGITPSLHALLEVYCGTIITWTSPAGFRLPDSADACRSFSVLIHPICAS
jgi:hypothetical protein